MELLFKREQTSGTTGSVKFKLWGKVELDEDETTIVSRYRFDNAILIAAIQPTLVRTSLYVRADRDPLGPLSSHFEPPDVLT